MRRLVSGGIAALTPLCHRECRRRVATRSTSSEQVSGRGLAGKRLPSGLLRRAGALQGLPPAAPDFMNATTASSLSSRAPGGRVAISGWALAVNADGGVASSRWRAPRNDNTRGMSSRGAQRRGDPFDRLRASLGQGVCGETVVIGVASSLPLQGLPPAAPDFMNATTASSLSSRAPGGRVAISGWALAVNADGGVASSRWRAPRNDKSIQRPSKLCGQVVPSWVEALNQR